MLLRLMLCANAERLLTPEQRAAAAERLRGARRIHLCGSCGAGKSTLAILLGQRLQLPVIHLDAEFWLPNWTQRPLPEWFEKTAALAGRDAWIMDGTYSRTLPLRLPHADAIILLAYNRWRCLWQVLKRVAFHWGTRRADMAEGCVEHLSPKFLKYVWQFEEKELPIAVRAIEAVEPGTLVLEFHSPKELRAFLRAL